LAGDAGGGVDPIVGCGVSVALRTGIAAAHAAARIVGGADPARESRAYAREYAHATRARRSLARGLLACSSRPALLRAVFVAARSWPSLTGALAAVAAGA